MTNNDWLELYIQLINNKKKSKHSCSKKILSTGVLRRHPDTLFLTVEGMNVDPNNSRSVTVQMFDWTSGSPVGLPLLDPSTQNFSPNRSHSFRSQALPSTTFLYEVRIIHPGDEDVVTNVFGLSALPFNPQEGNNIVQHDLATLKLK